MLPDSIHRTRESSIGRTQLLRNSDSLLIGKRCLVLDDEFLIALDIQQILELAGAKHVASVATASEAMELLRREEKFDVAVLDVKLGGPEGNSLGVASMLATPRLLPSGPPSFTSSTATSNFSSRRRSSMASDAVATDATCFAPASSSIC